MGTRTQPELDKQHRWDRFEDLSQQAFRRALAPVRTLDLPVASHRRTATRRVEIPIDGSQAGQALIEYALIISLIALIAIIALQTTGTDVSHILHRLGGSQ